MLTCIESPTRSQVYYSPTSPPPTPRKRAGLIYSVEEVPLFFPCSRSVLQCDGSSIPRKVDETDFLYQSSTIALRLKPRPKFGTTIQCMSSLKAVKEVPPQDRSEGRRSLQEMTDVLPPPPFASTSTQHTSTSSSASTIASIATNRNRAKSDSIQHDRLDAACANGSKTESSTKSNVQKLPSLPRMGMRNTVERRNSMVARSA